jgi:hypothetical protein
LDESVEYIKSAEERNPWYTGGIQRGLGGEENKERKSTKLITRGASQPAVQVKRVKGKKWSSSS